jgi:hypothetical protein
MGVDEASPTRKWHPIGTDPGGHLNVHILDAANVQLTSTLLGAKQSLDVNVANTSAIAISGTVTANAGTNLNTSALALETTQAKLTVAQGAALGTNTQTLIGGSVTTAAPAYTTGQISPLSLTTGGALRTDDAASVAQGTALGSTFQQMIGGSVTTAAPAYTTGNINPLSLTTGGALRTADTASVTQGSTTSGQSGQLTQGAVTTAAPAYTTAQTSPLSLTTGGLLRTQAAGDVASGTADSGNPVKVGYVARTTLPAAVTDGQRSNSISDKFGREVVVLGTPRDLRASQNTTITSSTTETTIVTAGGAGIFRDPVMILVSNTASGTNTRIDFRDATAGTIRFSLQCPANQTTGFNIPGESIPQTTAANNWTAQCGTSTNDIRIYVLYENNQ